ncbi:MAG: hypothetical protein PHH31_09660, partial [Acidaminococcaceae bacterium]|nr:hypothetical protein [Acidaminococcaceae bacterium]
VDATLCSVAVYKVSPKVDLRTINFKEQHLVGTRVYSRGEFKQAVTLSAVLQNDIEKIISHIIPLSKSDKVFDLISNAENGTIKVLIDCQR